MLASIAVVIIIAIIFSKFFEKIKLPPLLGMILAGLLLGGFTKVLLIKFMGRDIFNSYFNWLFIPDSILKSAPEIKTAALIVILIRAGLGISKKALQRVGGIATRMSIISVLFEAAILFILGRLFLGLNIASAGILAFAVAAVSPAVIVPSMLGLKDHKYGEDKEIPTLVLASSSLDNVLAITLFGAFIDMASAKNASGSMILEILKIPVSIITGIGIGLLLGYLVYLYFRKSKANETRKVLKFLLVAILFYHLQTLKIFPLAGLLGIIAMGFVLLEKDPEMAESLANKFNKIWIFAEIALFVLIGAQVNINVVFNSGLTGLLLIFSGLIARSAGILFSLIKSGLNKKERFFCVIAGLPKATVQAAVGGVALALVTRGQIFLTGGKSTGEFILAIAVLSIIVTAPIGAVGIKVGAEYLLNKGEVYEQSHNSEL